MLDVSVLHLGSMLLILLLHRDITFLNYKVELLSQLSDCSVGISFKVLDSLFQAIMACRCVLVPVSLSWADIRPTVDFIKLIQERKDQTSQACPHIIVVPNRVPPRQRDISEIANAMRGLDVVIAPGLSEISAVRKQAGAFTGLTGLKGTRYYDEFEKLGNFICDYVLSGKIDSMFDKTATQQGNVIRLQT